MAASPPGPQRDDVATRARKRTAGITVATIGVLFLVGQFALHPAPAGRALTAPDAYRSRLDMLRTFLVVTGVPMVLLGALITRDAGRKS